MSPYDSHPHSQMNSVNPLTGSAFDSNANANASPELALNAVFHRLAGGLHGLGKLSADDMREADLVLSPVSPVSPVSPLGSLS